MVVRMRHTRSQTGNRRSHHALEESQFMKCECGAMHLKHRACMACGRYRGRVVIDVAAKAVKQSVKRERRAGENEAK